MSVQGPNPPPVETPRWQVRDVPRTVWRGVNVRPGHRTRRSLTPPIPVFYLLDIIISINVLRPVFRHRKNLRSTVKTVVREVGFMSQSWDSQLSEAVSHGHRLSPAISLSRTHLVGVSLQGSVVDWPLRGVFNPLVLKPFNSRTLSSISDS